MAISARAAALREQRNRYATRKVLRPGSLRSSVNTIARQLADSEFDSMVDRYEDGVVGNEEMLSFLKSALSSDLFSTKEKVDIEDRIRDFQVRVSGDRLETVFNVSEGQAKADAAQALVSFYEGRATELQPGTPAQLSAINNVAKWNQKGVEVTNQIAKEARKIDRAERLFELSKLPPDDLNTLNEEAKVYQELAQQAMADGETAEGYDLAAKANDIINRQIPDKQKKIVKDTLTDAFQDLKNKYHDGEVSPLDAAAAAKEIDRVALENELYEMTGSINSFADGLQKDIEKGVTHGDINGLPFTIRKSGNEYETTVGQWREALALENDTFNSYMSEVNSIAEAAPRLLAQIELYTSYITGENTSGEPVDEFMGMQARVDTYELLHENTDKDYSNEIRDTVTKEQKLGDSLAKITYQYSSIVGDEGNDVVSHVYQNVLPEASRVTPGTGINQGVLVEFDEFGNQRERVVKLNSQVQTEDELGNPIIEDTYVGRNVAQTPDGRYVKLTPYYSTEAARSAGAADFYYTVYNGQYFTKSLADENIVPADQAAMENETVALWYSGVQAEDEAMKQRWAEIQGQAPVGPPGPPEGTILPPEQLPPPTLPERVFSQVGKPEFEPATPEEIRRIEPTVPDVPQVDYTTPDTAKVPAVGVGFQGFASPAQDINLDQYYGQNLSATPQATYLPPITVTPSTQQYQVPKTTQSPLQNVGELPKTPLQQSGIKLDLGDEFAPDLTSKPKNPWEKLTTGVKNAATGAVNWFKGLF